MGKIEEFLEAINKPYAGQVAQIGGRFAALQLKRFTSGILTLDVALGGGWPFSRVAMVAGEESTGKTLLALKAMAAVEDYDHQTKQHKTAYEGDIFHPGRALFIDAEGSFDIGWANANGFNEEHHVVARTEFAEQAIDIVTKAIQENHFDLIVIDSLAALTPSKEIEESAEDWQIGLRARTLNKAISRWNSSLVGMSQQNNWGPTVLCLNQFRIQIGQMYGDPRVMPGGRAQKFFTSLILYTKSPKYDDKAVGGKATELGKVTLSGVVHKNKTYMPRMNYAFDFALKTTDEIAIGTINNLDALMDLGKKHKLIVTKGGKVHFGKKEFGTQKEMKQTLAVSKELHRSLWISVVKAATGY